MAWHLGYPLSQTLLTSVYVEALMKVPATEISKVQFTRDPAGRDRQPKLLFVLRAYCIGMLRSCHMVNEVVKGALYYEEEDFVTNAYDRTLLCDLPLQEVTSTLQEARTSLRGLGNVDVPKDISAALDTRLELRLAFLRALELSSLVNANPDSLKMPWLQLQGLLELVKQHHGLGQSMPEAFSVKLQRRLASTMPPRPIVQLSFEDTYGHFKRVFQDGTDALDVLKYSDTQSLLVRSSHLLTCFSALCPNAC
jgi:N-alpha-acetyltransferase 35, NatC auxiliary subunit